MDGMLLAIGMLVALGGLIFIFLIWGEQEHLSQNTFDSNKLRAETKISDKSIPEEIHSIHTIDEGDNRVSTDTSMPLPVER